MPKSSPCWLTTLAKKLWGQYKCAIPAIVIVLCVVAALILTGVIPSCSCATTRLHRTGTPLEFAYLDSTRADSYRAQLSGGNIESESRQEVSSQTAGLGLEVNNVGKATASRSTQLTRNVVVTQTEADRFDELLSELKAQPSFREFDAARCDFGERLAPSTVPAGTMVMIKNALVRMPPYLSVYPELRGALYRLRLQSVFGPAPLYSFQQVDESVRGTPKREREAFKKTVGSNPRVPFTITTPYTRKEVDACIKSEPDEHQHVKATRQGREVTVFLPARFASLTGDPSLLSQPLTIVGMVVSNSVGTFGDGVSVSTYWPALSAAKAPLLGELGVGQPFLEMKRPVLREELFKAMAESLTFKGHVVEVVPIAMYD
ncbi:MAG: hypothetical protein ABSB69_19755 [Solirubrobacteraceae bacterium]